MITPTARDRAQLLLEEVTPQRVRDLRHALGLTQTQMATALGYHEVTIRQSESNFRPLTDAFRGRVRRYAGRLLEAPKAEATGPSISLHNVPNSDYVRLARRAFDLALEFIAEHPTRQGGRRHGSLYTYPLDPTFPTVLVYWTGTRAVVAAFEDPA